MKFKREIEHECPVCEAVHGKHYVYADSKMLPLTVHELCEYHREVREEGGIFFLEVEEPDEEVVLDYHNAVRTGKFITIEKILADGLAKGEVPTDEHGVVFIPRDAFKRLKSILDGMPGLEELDEH